MRAVRLALIAFAAVILDAALAPEIEIAGARPDFLVMVIVYASLIMGGRAATIVGFLLGLAADAEVPEYMGLNALALSATAYATSGLWSHLVRTNVFVQCLVLFAGSLLHDIIYYFFYYRNHLDMLGRFLVRFGVPGGLYTAAFGGLIFLIARSKNWRAVAGGAHR